MLTAVAVKVAVSCYHNRCWPVVQLGWRWVIRVNEVAGRGWLVIMACDGR
jgi:hypothetical protein